MPITTVVETFPCVAPVAYSDALRDIESLSDLWARCQPTLDADRIRILAWYLSRVRHARVGRLPDEREKAEARLDWLEAEWMIRTLRPSLVLDAAFKPGGVVAYLDRLQSESVELPLGGEQVKVIAAIDGGPEFRHDCYRAHRSNGVLPEDLVNRKDIDFYRLCFFTMGRYEVCPLGAHRPTFYEEEPEPEEVRTFQDAFVGVVSGDNSIVTSVTAVTELQRRLATLNEEKDRRWNERIHVRVVLASCWSTAVAGLSCVWRGNCAIEQELWKSLGSDLRQVLGAQGFKPIRIKEEWEPSVEAIRNALGAKRKAAASLVG